MDVDIEFFRIHGVGSPSQPHPASFTPFLDLIEIGVFVCLQSASFRQFCPFSQIQFSMQIPMVSHNKVFTSSLISSSPLTHIFCHYILSESFKVLYSSSVAW